MDIDILTKELQAQLQQLTQFNATPGNGVTRFPFTNEAKAATEYLRNLMEEAGLVVRLDNSGALIGRLEGQVPETIMIGSHLDSVKNGGAYDGIAGVVCAIAVAKELKRKNLPLHYSLEVIATNDEEGARFNTGLFTGKVLLGQVSVEDIKQQVDSDGITVYEAMKAYGLEPEAIQKHIRRDIKAFLEIHIEQGPVLEHAKKSLGIVEVIVGIHRCKVTIFGRADHAGTMPMHMRRDAMTLAAKVIAPIHERALSYPNAVTTVGFMTLEPNIMNIVPEKVTFGVDIRGISAEAIEGMYQGLMRDLQRLSQELDIAYKVEDLMYAAPVAMNTELKQLLEQGCQNHNYSYMHLPSGAGHDAQIFGKELPAAMLFVPSVGGRSHCPQEKSAEVDLAKAVQVMYDTVEKLVSSKADPFYSEENLEHLKRAIKQIEAGRTQVHELIEPDN